MVSWQKAHKNKIQRRNPSTGERPVGTWEWPGVESEHGKVGERFRAQTAAPERESERRGPASRAGKEKFCPSHLCWAPGAAGKAREPVAIDWGCRGGERELGARVGALAKPSSQVRRGDWEGPFRGRSVQRFPAGEERISDSPAAVPACAPVAARAPVPAPWEPGPRPADSLALSAFLLCAPVDNGWQLSALRTKVRPASPFAKPSAP